MKSCLNPCSTTENGYAHCAKHPFNLSYFLAQSKILAKSTLNPNRHTGWSYQLLPLQCWCNLLETQYVPKP